MIVPRAMVRRLAALAGCAVLVVAPAACSGSDSPAVPSFHASPGKFRVVPQPTHGAPPPQVLSYGGHRLLATLADVHGSGTAAQARLLFGLQDQAVEVPSREYRTGDTVRVGPVQVHIDGVYGSGEKNIAVDVTLS